MDAVAQGKHWKWEGSYTRPLENSNLRKVEGGARTDHLQGRERTRPREGELQGLVRQAESDDLERQGSSDHVGCGAAKEQVPCAIELSQDCALGHFGRTC